MFNRENLTKKDWLAKAEEFKQTAIESRTKEQSKVDNWQEQLTAREIINSRG